MKHFSLFKKFQILICFLITTGITSTALAQDPQPLNLETALDLALKNNFDVLRAEAEREGIKGSLIRIKSGRLPRLDLNANFNQIDPDLLESFGGSSFGSDRSWSVNLEFTQPLYHGGKDRFATARENANLKAATATVEETLLEVILNTKKAWYQVILARELIKVQTDSNELLKQELERSKNRFETGAISRFELLRAEVALANNKPPLIRAKNNYRLAIIDLYRILGLPTPSDDPAINNDTLDYNPLAIDWEDALSIAKKNRSQFIVLEEERKAAEAQVHLEKSDYLPSLDFVAGYGIQKSSFSNELNATIDGWNIGIQGNWNIWNSGETKGTLIEKKSALRKTELSISDFELEIELAIHRAIYELEEADELVKASEKVVEQAEEALKLAKDRYEVGSAIQLDLLDAEVALTDAKTNSISARYDYNVAKAKLERELGLRVLTE